MVETLQATSVQETGFRCSDRNPIEKIYQGQIRTKWTEWIMDRISRIRRLNRLKMLGFFGNDATIQRLNDTTKDGGNDDQ